MGLIEQVQRLGEGVGEELGKLRALIELHAGKLVVIEEKLGGARETVAAGGPLTPADEGAEIRKSFIPGAADLFAHLVETLRCYKQEGETTAADTLNRILVERASGMDSAPAVVEIMALLEPLQAESDRTGADTLRRVLAGEGTKAARLQADLDLSCGELRRADDALRTFGVRPTDTISRKPDIAGRIGYLARDRDTAKAEAARLMAEAKLSRKPSRPRKAAGRKR